MRSRNRVRFAARALNVTAIIIFAFPSFQIVKLGIRESFLAFGLGALVLALGQIIEFRITRAADVREHELRGELSHLRDSSARQLATLLRDLETEQHVRSAMTATLIRLQQRRLTYWQQALHGQGAAAWNTYCEKSLGALVDLWREYYFDGDVTVTIRGTLFERGAAELIPLRRSSGGSQFDPAVTHWKIGEGVAGKVAEIHTACLVADVVEEQHQSITGSTPNLFAARSDRPGHQNIRSVFCAPLEDANGNTRWVLSVDTTQRLPYSQEYYKDAPDSPVRMTAPLLSEFAHVLLSRDLV